MKWVLRVGIALVVLVAAVPFIVLSAMGFMRPTEGFCLEDVWLTKNMHDLPSDQEQAQSFFVSPELADPTMRVPFVDEIFAPEDPEGLNWRWPLCLRSRQAMHHGLAGFYEHQLTKLGEPNLRRRDHGARVYRVVTSPSFSRVPIAFRLEVDGTSGAGTLHSAWLEDDGTNPDDTKTTPAGDEAWWNAPLPRRTTQRALSAGQTRALEALFADLPPYQMFNLDGIALAIEAVHDGRREARSAFLFPPPDPTGRLFCALAKQSGIATKVLEDGDVNICDAQR